MQRFNSSASKLARQCRRGFTLVEILIVVIILGILAAIVIPQFTNASTSAKTSSLQSTLALVRGQISLFSAQHLDTLPVLTDATAWTVMTGWTNTSGATTASASSASYPFGPYLQSVPINPQNNKSAVTNATTSTGAGWYYTVSGNGFTFEARDASGVVITTY